MQIIDTYGVKKVYHYLMENNHEDKYVYLVLPDILNLHIFDPIYRFLKERFSKVTLYSGVIETIKNRAMEKDYVFINVMNRETLKKYNVILIIPPIYDFDYFLPEVIGYENIPNIKVDQKFNYVIDHYQLKDFYVVNLEKDCDIKFYISKLNKIDFILIGDSISCAEFSNYYKNGNPPIVYKNNVPLIIDLIKKSKGVVGNNKPDIPNIKYEFHDIHKF
jgi:hypothetical protein